VTGRRWPGATEAALRVAALLATLVALGCQPRTFPIRAGDAAAPDMVLVPDAIADPELVQRPDGMPGETGPTCTPSPEICNERDDDCDGMIDEGFELQTDPANCGRCGITCSFANATPLCAAGRCRFDACATGHVDLDGVPQNGCECALTNNAQEICDGQDNDCDGTADQGFDLSSDIAHCGACGQACSFANAGATCDQGTCKMTTCQPGHLDLDRVPRNGCEYACVPSNGGLEICDREDNDCDGDIDESDPRVGSACFPDGAVGCNAGTGVCAGPCKLGRYVCLPGGLGCMGAVLPESDVCDGVDNDCDGQVDEDFDLQNDPRWCGACGQVCSLPRAVNACVAGACAVKSCQAGFVDLDGQPANGCEYACTADGPEVCDGLDNDCDGRIDAADNDLLAPPANFCVQRGECGKGPGGSPRYPEATFPVCVAPAPGQSPDWVCNYPATVELFGPNQVAGLETLCDGLDNDCDGSADEDVTPALGSACTDTGVGECKRRGVIRCAADRTASPVCDVTGVPMPPANHELCDGLDNDCDGQIDESWDTPAGVGLPDCGGTACRGVRDDLARVAVGPQPFWIYRYEASRIDATAADEGKVDGRACSRTAGGTPLRPWASVAYAQARAACAAAGMRLCRTRRAATCSSGPVLEDEWGQACSAGIICGADPQPYPTGCSYDPAICNGMDAVHGAPLASGALPLCQSADLDTSTVDRDSAFDLSGNLAEWTEDCRTILSDGTGRRAYTLRGGSFTHGERALRCDFMSLVVAENFAFSDTGFRCCSSCPPGQADCNGTCADLGTTAAHCGLCGNACGAGLTCRNGRCQ
jgi:hypothetical protein